MTNVLEKRAIYLSNGTEQKNKRAAGLSIVTGMMVITFMIVLFFTAVIDLDNEYERMLAEIMCIAGVTLIICSVIIALLGSAASDAFKRHRAALRALGKHGIRIVAKDKTARLAYKGIVQLLKGDFPRCESLLTQALSSADVRENQLFCVEWLIRLYEATDNTPKLLWCFRKAADLAPERTDAQARLGYAYFSQGKLENAKYCFEQVLRYDPNDGYSYYNLAKIYTIWGEDEKAFEALQMLVKVNGNHPLAHAELAVYYAMHDDEEKCREAYNKSIACGNGDPENLSKEITAIFTFNHSKDAGKNDLPHEYYKDIEEDESDAGDE